MLKLARSGAAGLLPRRLARGAASAADAPQLQKATSERGSPRTLGGAYAERDDPRTSAAPPTEGKTDAEIVREQTAGGNTAPRRGGPPQGARGLNTSAAARGYGDDEVVAAEHLEAARKEKEEGLHAADENADGETVARRHLHAELVPQLQRETSEHGSPRVRGCSYPCCNDPRYSAAPPVDGKADDEIVREQTAGASTALDGEAPPGLAGALLI